MATSKKQNNYLKKSSMMSSTINNPLIVPPYMVTLSVLVPKDCYAECLAKVSEVLLQADKNYKSKKHTRNLPLVLKSESEDSSTVSQGQNVVEAIGLKSASKDTLPNKKKKKNKRPKKRSRKSKLSPVGSSSNNLPKTLTDSPSKEIKDVLELVKGYKFCASLTKNASVRGGFASKIDTLLKTLSSSESDPESIKTLDFEKTMFVENAVTTAVKNRSKSKIPMGTQIKVEGVSVDTAPSVSLVKPGLPVHTSDILAIGALRAPTTYPSQRNTRVLEFYEPEIRCNSPSYDNPTYDSDGDCDHDRCR